MNLEIRLENNPENFIFLEAAQRGNHEYPDLMISMHNLGMSYIGDASRKMDFALEDTAKTNDGVSYIGNLNHKQAKELVIASGYYPLNTRLFADFLREIRVGAYENKNVFDARGNKVNSERLKVVDDEITTVRSPYRGRWLSDEYKQKNDGMYVSFYVMKNGKPELLTEKLDGDTLVKDRTPGVDINSWIKNPTNQGLPRKDTKKGVSYYWYPRDGYVARFGAGSGLAYLYCVRYPGNSYSSLGVQFCAEGARCEN